MSISSKIEKLPPAAREFLQDKEGKALDELAAFALENDAVMEVLVACLTEKNEVLRYNAVRTLERLATQHPERLYPAWEILTGLAGQPQRVFTVQVELRCWPSCFPLIPITVLTRSLSAI